MPKFLKVMSFSAKDAERQFSFNRFESDSGEGYQRQPQPGRIKEMAAFAETHKRWVFPVINAVLNDDMTLEILDGQNRALAGMLAGVEIPVAVWEMPEAEKAEFFVLWNGGVKPTKSHIIAVSHAGKKLASAFARAGITLHRTTCWTEHAMSYGSAVTYIDMLANGRAKNASNTGAIDWIVATPEPELNALASRASEIRSTFVRSRAKPEHRTIHAIMTLAHYVPGLTTRDIERICTTCPPLAQGTAVDEVTKISVLTAYNKTLSAEKRLQAWPSKRANGI